MRLLISAILACLSSVTAADSIKPDALRALVLERKVHQLEQEMILAQAAYVAGETEGEHLRNLNKVFETTSPKIRDVAAHWLSAYPESAYALMANASVSTEIAWTIRGNSYASDVYAAAWPAFEIASQHAAELTIKAYAINPSYLPASDGYLRQALYKNVAVSPELVVHSVLAEAPNAGTLIRGLGVAHKGWGGSYARGERLCSIHSRKVEEWGEQAFDICMIHMAYNYTRWEPMREFAERLLRTEHPSILDIRRNVIVKANFYYAGWYETVSQMNFPKEEWRKDLIDHVNADDFSDLSMAVEFDSRFANYTDLEMIVGKVRPRARAKAEAVLKYDPYNIDAILTLLNHDEFEMMEDGHRRFKMIDDLNSHERNIDLVKRLAMAKPWDPVSWKRLDLYFPSIPKSLDELKARREIEANYVAYSNHRPVQLRDFIESNRHLIDTRERALAGMSAKGQKWLLEVDHIKYFYCPVARAMILFETACGGQTSAMQREACTTPIYKVERLNAVVESMKNDPNCIVSQHPSFTELQFTPVDLDIMSLELD